MDSRNVFYYFCLIFFGTLFSSCTKDRFSDTNSPIDSIISPDSSIIDVHSLFINELLAKGSNLTSDLGNTADWAELYNPSNSIFKIEKGRWFLSDDLTELDKFQITQDFFIQPKSYLVLFCDDSAKMSQFIHTNFGLSAGGENLIVSYKKSDSTLIVIDSKTFGPQESNISIGRSPDGSDNWTSFPNPTPGATNN
jgi:hypothetical protein